MRLVRRGAARLFLTHVLRPAMGVAPHGQEPLTLRLVRAGPVLRVRGSPASGAPVRPALTLAPHAAVGMAHDGRVRLERCIVAAG